MFLERYGIMVAILLSCKIVGLSHDNFFMEAYDNVSIPIAGSSSGQILGRNIVINLS